MTSQGGRPLVSQRAHAAVRGHLSALAPNRHLLSAMAVLLLTAALTAGCGSGAGNSSETSASQAPVASTTTSPVAPATSAAPVDDLGETEAALEEFARQAGSDVIYSPVVSVPGGKVGVVTYGSPEQAEVLRYEDNSWQRITILMMPIGAVVATGIQGPETCDFLCIETAALTGSTNFLLTLPGADHVELVVLEVADDARSARVVPFDQAGELLASAVDGVVSGQTITSSENNCIPNCAEGTSTYTPWSYDPTSEMFRPALGE